MRFLTIFAIVALTFGTVNAAFAEDNVSDSSRDIQGNANHGISGHHWHHHHHHHWHHHHD